MRISLALIPFSIPVMALLALDPPKVTVPPRGYVCHKATAAPTIDGKLDDAAWANAPWSESFVDIEGDAKPKPRHRTRMKMLWDEKALYIAAEIDEPNVWATITQHDAVIFQDPDFEVFLDPDGDSHLYAELELNAKNTTWDLLLTKPYKDGGHAINAWEILGLKTAVQVNGTLNDPRDQDKGWTVEIAWRWDGLKELSKTTMPPKDGDRWRMNFSRVEWDTVVEDGKTIKVKGKPENNWIWSPQGVIDMHRPERWGYVQFTSKSMGNVKYVPDPNQAEFDRLHDLYYAQHAYHENHKRYATLAELGWTKGTLPDFERTQTGFNASILKNDTRLGISQDARTWRQLANQSSTGK